MEAKIYKTIDVKQQPIAVFYDWAYLRQWLEAHEDIDWLVQFSYEQERKDAQIGKAYVK